MGCICTATQRCGWRASSGMISSPVLPGMDAQSRLVTHTSQEGLLAAGLLSSMSCPERARPADCHALMETVGLAADPEQQVQ